MMRYVQGVFYIAWGQKHGRDWC